MRDELTVGITGSSGFLGSHLTGLVGDLPKVKIFRYSSKIKETNSEKSLVPFELLQLNKFKVVPVDILFHLAWADLPNYHSIIQSEQVGQHLAFIRENLEAGTKRIFVAGTEAEYVNKVGGISENHPVGPTNRYSSAKLQILDEIGRMNSAGADILWGRIFHTFGSGQPPHSLYGSFQKAVKLGLSEFKLNNSNLALDFSHVGEVVSKILKLSLNQEAKGVFNIASGRPTEIGNLVRDWVDESGSDIRIVSNSQSSARDSYWANTDKYSRLFESE